MQSSLGTTPYQTNQFRPGDEPAEQRARSLGSNNTPFVGGAQSAFAQDAARPAGTTLLHASDRIAHINRAAAATGTAAELIATFVGRERDDLVSSNYREGCAVAPIVIESTPASDQLSDVTRRAFQDLITTLAARLAEKGLIHDRAVQLATNVWTSVEGALILSRALRSPEPFDMAITQLTATAKADADASMS
jgi:hypothetical protein